MNGSWIRLDGGLVCDPASMEGVGERTIWMHEGRVADPPDPSMACRRYDVSGCLVMAGGVDLHTHIGGGKANIARLMMPERPAKRQEFRDGERPLTCPVPPTVEAGRRYLEMGYTTCFEPAIVPTGARQAHYEMSDTPNLDTGGYLVMGNEEILLRMLGEGGHAEDHSANLVRDYVGWMLQAHQCVAVKVVNAGEISRHQWGGGESGLDVVHPRYGVTPRRILLALAKAVEGLGLAHPLHVHAARLGRANNIETTLETIRAVEGHRMHLTHAQFHAYGGEGPHGYSSAAERLAEVVNRQSEISLDVGQVLFGQTATLSADVPSQFAHRQYARPKKFVFQQLEGQAGCGVMPFRYRESQYVHSLQWAIGLELFLRVEDPWRIFLTTDHPNGAPFVAYPHVMRLLMDYDYRMECFEALHPDVRSTHPLPSLKREYGWEEIAIVTRTGPARSLGLRGCGDLQVGSWADVSLYRMEKNVQSMLARPEMVWKRGKLVVERGEQMASAGKSRYRLDMPVEFRPTAELIRQWESHYQQPMSAAVIRDEELWEYGGAEVIEVRREAKG